MDIVPMLRCYPCYEVLSTLTELSSLVLCNNRVSEMLVLLSTNSALTRKSLVIDGYKLSEHCFTFIKFDPMAHSLPSNVYAAASLTSVVIA